MAMAVGQPINIIKNSGVAAIFYSYYGGYYDDFWAGRSASALIEC